MRTPSEGLEGAIDAARAEEASAAEKQRARWLVSGHADARLEWALLSDFDAERADDEDDEARGVLAAARALSVIAAVRDREERKKREAADDARSSHVMPRVSLPAASSDDARAAEAAPSEPEREPLVEPNARWDVRWGELELRPEPTVERRAPRVASAMATPPPTSALVVARPNASKVRIAASVIALGVVVIGTSVWASMQSLLRPADDSDRVVHVAAIAPPPMPPPEPERDVLAEARAMRDDGRPAAAARLLRAEIAEHPDSPESLEERLLLGEIFERSLHRARRARIEYTAVARRDPDGELGREARERLRAMRRSRRTRE